MHYNIYFGFRRLSFAHKPADSSDYVIIRPALPSREEVVQLLKYHHAVTFISPEPDQSLEGFAEQFIPVLASGGVVRNPEGLYLMILRGGRWDLPKGHWEEGESIAECALREVEEETGVGELTLGEEICSTRHTYSIYGQWELKTTHWFHMTSSWSHELTPQTEEGIEAVEWCSKEQVQERIADSYPTIREIFQAIGEL